MANKKSKSQKQVKPGENPGKKRIRMLEIFFAVFCVLIILSMILAAIAQ
jgi:hypothetical protein